MIKKTTVKPLPTHTPKLTQTYRSVQKCGLAYWNFSSKTIKSKTLSTIFQNCPKFEALDSCTGR